MLSWKQEITIRNFVCRNYIWIIWLAAVKLRCSYYVYKHLKKLKLLQFWNLLTSAYFGSIWLYTKQLSLIKTSLVQEPMYFKFVLVPLEKPPYFEQNIKLNCSVFRPIFHLCSSNFYFHFLYNSKCDRLPSTIIRSLLFAKSVFRRTFICWI